MGNSFRGTSVREHIESNTLSSQIYTNSDDAYLKGIPLNVKVCFYWSWLLCCTLHDALVDDNFLKILEQNAVDKLFDVLDDDSDAVVTLKDLARLCHTVLLLNGLVPISMQDIESLLGNESSLDRSSFEDRGFKLFRLLNSRDAIFCRWVDICCIVYPLCPPMEKVRMFIDRLESCNLPFIRYHC